MARGWTCSQGSRRGLAMKTITAMERVNSPQEMADQETYYWVVSLWAGNPESGVAIGVKNEEGLPYRELVTKKYERALELAEYWLNNGKLSDDRQIFVTIEEMAVKSSVVYVK
jgi:hypothetical protein